MHQQTVFRKQTPADKGIASVLSATRLQVFNNLATEKDLRQRMLEQGAAPAIIALAASSHNRHLRSECVEALCKLAVQPGSEAQIIAEVREVQLRFEKTRVLCVPQVRSDMTNGRQ